jgi:hypothetical protein
MEENRILKKNIIDEFENKAERYTKKIKSERMEDWLVEKGERKGYITERNGRSS